jgi:teichuronic acid biosynthesis glycosyltransferase TuaC
LDNKYYYDTYKVNYGFFLAHLIIVDWKTKKSKNKHVFLMKLLFITNYFPKKNGETDALFLYWRVTELIKHGHHVTILKWNQNMRDIGMASYNILDLKSSVLKSNIPVIPIHSYQLWMPYTRKKWHQWIHDQFDIVHFHWLWSMTVFPTIAQWHIPFVVTCHGSDIYRMGESFNQWALGRWLNRRVVAHQMARLNTANHVIFVSKNMAINAQKKGFSNKHSIVPNGYNCHLFKPFKVSSNTNKICIGFVGNLLPIKRADKLPEIIKKIHAALPIATFLIIGEGPLRESIERECQPLKNTVKFTGKQPPQIVAEYMQQMTVLMIPSRSESFGCVIKEAQACGVSVVGSDAGGIPDVIGHGGIVVVDGDGFEDRFSNAVVQLAMVPICPNILKKESEQYQWENTVMQEQAIYQDIISARF